MWGLRLRRVFSASHQLRGHGGGCEKLHGHNWKVVVELQGDSLDELGLLLDFRDIQGALDGLLARFDHSHLNDDPAFATMNPSCENMALVLHRELSEAMRRAAPQLRVAEVEVFETEECSAYYRQEGEKTCS